MKGRLHQSYDHGANELGATKPVLEIIKDGYYLPLLCVPNSFSSPNHKSALQNKGFVDRAIADLLHSYCIRSVEIKPHICGPCL